MSRCEMCGCNDCCGADYVEDLAERDAEIERLRGEVAALKGKLLMERDLVDLHYNAQRRLEAELSSERKRARLPEALVRRLRAEAPAHPGFLIEDILAAVEQGEQ